MGGEEEVLDGEEEEVAGVSLVPTLIMMCSLHLLGISSFQNIS